MNKVLSFYIICLVVGCTRQSPQLPANKLIETDSVATAIQMANQRLIEGEDSILQNYVSDNKLQLQKTTSGLWFKIYNKTNGERLSDLQNCQISYKVRSLTGAVLLTKSEKIIIGKKQVISGIEETLLKMHKGEDACVLIPWYLAYGMKGNGDEIPPYTSVLVDLKLQN